MKKNPLLGMLTLCGNGLTAAAEVENPNGPCRSPSGITPTPSHMYLHECGFAAGLRQTPGIEAVVRTLAQRPALLRA